jgi:hypothetical protein
MRWRTQFGAVIGRLPVGRPYLRKWPFVARSYGRWCMYGPNYVKLSGAFAVRLFSMSIPYYLYRARYPRPGPGPIGPTAMPSPPPFASPSPRHCNTHCSRVEPRKWQLHDMPKLSAHCTRAPRTLTMPGTPAENKTPGGPRQGAERGKKTY